MLSITELIFAINLMWSRRISTFGSASTTKFSGHGVATSGAILVVVTGSAVVVVVGGAVVAVVGGTVVVVVGGTVVEVVGGTVVVVVGGTVVVVVVGSAVVVVVDGAMVVVEVASSGEHHSHTKRFLLSSPTSLSFSGETSSFLLA